MQKSEIQIDQEYVLREEKDPNVPLQRVKIIQHVRRKKWKAEWIDPNPGLVDVWARWEREARELKFFLRRLGAKEKQRQCRLMT